jgi:hypothetical protein
MRRSLLLLVCTAFLPLTGCDTLSGLFDNTPRDPVDPGPICPATAVLSDAATVTKVKAGTSAVRVSPGDISLEAEMTQARLVCHYNRADNKLTVDLSLPIRATRGPAATATDPLLPFFVAVIDADNNVISKSVYNSQPQLAGRMSNLYNQSVSDFGVPLAMDKRPYDYELLTGFQLTPDELAYNRAPRMIPAPRAAAR